MLYIGQQFPFDLIRLSVTGPPPISSVPYCSVATELSWHVVLVPSCSTANCNRLANQLTSSYDIPACNNAKNSWVDEGMSGTVAVSAKGTCGGRSLVFGGLLVVALILLTGLIGSTECVDACRCAFFVGRPSTSSACRFLDRMGCSST